MLLIVFLIGFSLGASLGILGAGLLAASKDED